MSFQHSDLLGFTFRDDSGCDLVVVEAWEVNPQYVVCLHEGSGHTTLRRAEQIRLLKAAEEGLHGVPSKP